jgi:uncharacterized protein
LIIILAGAIAFCALFILYMFWEAHRNIVLKQSIECPGLPSSFNNYTLYFISDIHRRKVSTKMLESIEKPDLVIIGGDLMEKGVPFSRVDENLRRLKKIGAPILFVWGNHDLQVNRDTLVSLLDKYQIIRLENQAFIAHREGQTVNILGVNDATNYLDNVDEAIRDAEPGFRLLISHNPLVVERIGVQHHIPLVICGHTHGGQIRLFGWGIRESGGIKSKPFGKLVISCGYGTTRFHLRLGAPPDTLFIRLKQK